MVRFARVISDLAFEKRMMYEVEHKDFWKKIESFLKDYDLTYAPVRWFGGWGGLTRGREGYFVFLRFIFLISLYLAAFYLPSYSWLGILMTIVAGYSIADMFLLPTSIVFGGTPADEAVTGFDFCFHHVYLDRDGFRGVIYHALSLFL